MMEEKKENENDLILKKADFYHKDKQVVHIVLKNGKFYNGGIIYVGADFLMLNDRKLGELPVFYLEIHDITPFKEGL